MARRDDRTGSTRARIAAAAARLMAEDGIDDFALAKRKAAKQIGALPGHALPGNDEIEAELRAYRELYQSDEHPALAAELLGAALEAMRALEAFRPYLTGPVLAGLAGPYSEIELQLFPESAKEVEVFLLEHSLPFSTREVRRFSGARGRPVSLFDLSWDGIALKLYVFDPRDERVAIKTSQAGRPLERAGLAEVEAMVQSSRKDLRRTGG